MPHPTEDSICPPAENRQLIVSDKDGEQCHADGHSSECSYEAAPSKFEEVDGVEDEQGTNHISVASKRRRQKSLSIAAYAVQCFTCEKWRIIPTKQKYEELRAHILRDPYNCERGHEWKPDVTCNDPPDVSKDDKWLWAMDRPNIPQPPPGFERLIAIRGEGCTRFADVYYETPSGSKLRSGREIGNYLKENTEYAAQGVDSSQFSFKIPAPAQQNYVRKYAKTSQNGGLHIESSKSLLEKGEANWPVLVALRRPYIPTLSTQPIACLAPQTHEEPRDNNQLVVRSSTVDEGPPELLLLPEPPETELGSPPQPPAV